MMNIRQRSVNVERFALLIKLRENLEIHKKEYAEALTEFHARLLSDLKTAVKKVESTENIDKLRNFRINVPFPLSHAKEYEEVIEMLEMSVDDTINLDAESFKAYIKNEWAWSASFETTKMLYATPGAFLSD